MTSAGASDFSGRWLGGFEIPEGWRFMQLDLEVGSNVSVAGKADVLFGSLSRPPESLTALGGTRHIIADGFP